MRTLWQKGGGLCFTLGGAQYLLAEKISALAWHAPDYSYRQNYISDLGIASCGMTADGRDICSPLHTLMNSGFAIEGILFFSACWLLRRIFHEPGRSLFLLFGLLHGMGGVMIALFHSGGGTDGVTLHQTGAVMAIGGGNLCLLSAAWVKRNSDGWRVFSRLSLLLGGVGLVSMFTISLNVLPVGIIERMSVYTITCWQIVVGIWLFLKNQE
ncbi:DUF998 domain-containing protein [Enterobacteriaceae bacterium Kacie_13]|nr:DUF998 domain-containing protein [Enterobacteriaceae bacterium Kacie_13]